jgi:TatD DNase family protein
MFIDTHAHIYSEEFKEDFESMLQKSLDVGVTDIFMPNIDSTSFEDMMIIAQNYSNCHPMNGLHPCYVKENYLEELTLVESKMEKHTFSAIGEIGIDLYWDKTFAKEQELAFRRQIALAKDAGLPFVIHSRDSLEKTIEIVSELQDGSLKGIYHCFNGSIAQAQRVIDNGFLMGIGGVITYKNAGVDKVVADIPIEYMVLETDAPYLSPVPYRGKRNESSYVMEVATKLAEIKNLSVEEVGRITTQNALNLFKVLK